MGIFEEISKRLGSGLVQGVNMGIKKMGEAVMWENFVNGEMIPHFKSKITTNFKKLEYFYFYLVQLKKAMNYKDGYSANIKIVKSCIEYTKNVIEKLVFLNKKNVVDEKNFFKKIGVRLKLIKSQKEKHKCNKKSFIDLTKKNFYNFLHQNITELFIIDQEIKKRFGKKIDNFTLEDLDEVLKETYFAEIRKSLTNEIETYNKEIGKYRDKKKENNASPIAGNNPNIVSSNEKKKIMEQFESITFKSGDLKDLSDVILKYSTTKREIEITKYEYKWLVTLNKKVKNKKVKEIKEIDNGLKKKIEPVINDIFCKVKDSESINKDEKVEYLKFIESSKEFKKSDFKRETLSLLEKSEKASVNNTKKEGKNKTKDIKKEPSFKGKLSALVSEYPDLVAAAKKIFEKVEGILSENDKKLENVKNTVFCDYLFVYKTFIPSKKIDNVSDINLADLKNILNDYAKISKKNQNGNNKNNDEPRNLNSSPNEEEKKLEKIKLDIKNYKEEKSKKINETNKEILSNLSYIEKNLDIFKNIEQDSNDYPEKLFAKITLGWLKGFIKEREEVLSKKNNKEKNSKPRK
ncbi:MAG: hypothetical protein CfP315_0030 [Candidatus Improbicoccus pseudotrichonymphae]|uniref:Uncharacterized protein n=1 Tax=Candidatus Improbicoccus pseudotrichonymphae TaxID=3033792 RepID=A0AA48KY67_9FIRM|nr:MAG: hypothetical protein CfP315_0030 [Candidatus Improbicoccus pseudotrichonymphae]